MIYELLGAAGLGLIVASSFMVATWLGMLAGGLVLIFLAFLLYLDRKD